MIRYWMIDIFKLDIIVKKIELFPGGNFFQKLLSKKLCEKRGNKSAIRGFQWFKVNPLIEFSKRVLKWVPELL